MEHLNIKSFWSRKYNLIFFLTCTLADVHMIGNIQIICMSPCRPVCKNLYQHCQQNHNNRSYQSLMFLNIIHVLSPSHSYI